MNMSNNEARISRVTRSRAKAREGYNRLSRWYDLLAGSSERKWQEMALRNLDVEAGETALEIGFGTGHAILALARASGEKGKVHGIDISEGMHRAAQERVMEAGLSERVELQLGDAINLPFNDNFFDVVFMSFTLELFDTPEIPIVLGACRRVLRRGGRLGVAAMAKKEPEGRAVRLYEWAHARFPKYVDCRPIYVREAIEAVGFQVMEVQEVSMWGLPGEIVIARKA